MLTRTLTLFLIVTATAAAQPRWQLIGPWGTSTWRILPTPDGDLLASTENGMFISSDRGDTWHRNGPPGWPPVLAGAVSPVTGTVVGTGHPRTNPSFSTDKGASWNVAPVDKTEVLFEFFAASPGGILYGGSYGTWASRNSGVFRSADDGRTWQRLTLAPMNIDRILAPDDTTIIAATNGWTDVGLPSVYLSTDAGTTWTEKSREPWLESGINDLALDSSGVVWATTPKQVWKSTDRGRTWIDGGLRDTVDRPSAIAVSPDGTITVTTYFDNIWQTTNGGVSWQSVTPGFPRASAWNIVALEPEDLLVTHSSSTGIIRSRDNGATWSPSNVGIPSSASRLAVSKGRIVVANYWLSNDNGADWQPFSRGTGYMNATGVSDAGTYLFKSKDSLDRSTDGGATWSRTAMPEGFQQIWTNGAGDIFGFPNRAGGELSISRDDGITWTQHTFPQDAPNIRGVAFEGAVAGYIVSDMRLFRTLDNGISWTLARAGAADAITVDAQGKVIAATAEGILRSDDRGTTWSVIADTSIRFTTLATAPDSSILGGTAGRGIWRSIDGGAHWLPFSEGLTDSSISRIAVDRTTGMVYAGTRWGGLFMLVDGISSVAVEGEVQRIRRVGDELIFAGDLVIYNLLGQPVMRSASGRWNISAMPAGVYLYRLSSPGWVCSGKLVF